MALSCSQKLFDEFEFEERKHWADVDWYSKVFKKRTKSLKKLAQCSQETPLEFREALIQVLKRDRKILRGTGGSKSEVTPDTLFIDAVYWDE